MSKCLFVLRLMWVGVSLCCECCSWRSSGRRNGDVRWKSGGKALADFLDGGVRGVCVWGGGLRRRMGRRGCGAGDV